jgi:16S rRNA (guanine1207-N2)-methyltransferase
MNDASLTLLHPFQTGALDVPADGPILILNASETAARGLIAGDVTAVQDFRPDYLQLERAGIRVLPEPEGEGYAMALVLASKHRALGEHWVSEANARIRPGGLVVVAGSKSDGIDSLRKRLSARFELLGQESKHHGKVFWFAASASPAAPLEPVEVEGGFRTKPGMFSHERVDAGSELLAAHLPDDLFGAVADLGAGWGYLSVSVAQRCRKVKRIDLFEAGFAAARAGEANMKALAPGVESRTRWFDVTAEDPKALYDAVVMNPPFHTGRRGDPDIGVAMISAARRFLKPGGRMFMVANSHLPYEAALKTFSQSMEIVRSGGFKVIAARK